MNKLLFIIDLIKKLMLSPEEYAKSIGVNVGENCVFYGVEWSSEPYLITVGNDCQITDGVKIFTHGGSHMIRREEPNFDSFGKVVISDGVYIGNNSLIMPGVTIGKNVLIAAGSVITKSIPDNVCVGGNPAKIICSTEDYKKKNLPYNIGTKGKTAKQKKFILLETKENMFIKKNYLER